MKKRETTNKPPQATDERHISADGETALKTRQKMPSMYKVIMLNDDVTPMDFVTRLIQRVFKKTKEEANNLMLQIHYEGQAVCGIYTYEIAETKASLVMDEAKEHRFPLQCKLEKA